MKHIGDDYYEFTCPCGEVVLVRLGDEIHMGMGVLFCATCGKDHPTFKFGKKDERVICDLCRERIDEVDDLFPTEHDDGEIRSLCQRCRRLDWDGEEWKDA